MASRKLNILGFTMYSNNVEKEASTLPAGFFPGYVYLSIFGCYQANQADRNIQIPGFAGIAMSTKYG